MMTELAESTENLQVFVRVRNLPPPPDTSSSSHTPPSTSCDVVTDGGRSVTPTLTPRGSRTAKAASHHQPTFTTDSLAVLMKDQTCEVRIPQRGRFPFTFDNCFWSNEETPIAEKPFCSQEDLFDQVGKPLVAHAMEGFNASIIAYGQTGSGKTYSIFGPPDSLGTDNEGLIPRVCNSLFRAVNSASLTPRSSSGSSALSPSLTSSMKGAGKPVYKVFLSMLEVYLEDVYDLLASRKKLHVRGDTQCGFHVSGSKQVPVSNYKDVMQQLVKAEQLKTYAATAIHDRSSRAHTLFQLEVRAYSGETCTTSKIVLADLAGSERVKAAKTESGKTFDQACNINLSLLNLGTCIEAVVARARANNNSHPHHHHPASNNIGEFRNSTLTKLLKDYIGGNSRTSMLVTISPGLRDVTATLQALRFANRAKQITNHAVLNTYTQKDSETEAIAVEQIQNSFSKRRKALEKEMEIEIAQSLLQKRQDKLEMQSIRLKEERIDLEARMAEMSAQEKTRAAARITDLELIQKQHEKETSLARQSLEELEAKFLDVCADQSSLLSDKEDLLREVSNLKLEFEALGQEHADDIMLRDVERDQERAQMEEKMQELRQRHHESLAAQHRMHVTATTQWAEEKTLLEEGISQRNAKIMDQDQRILDLLSELENWKSVSMEHQQKNVELQVQFTKSAALAEQEKASELADMRKCINTHLSTISHLSELFESYADSYVHNFYMENFTDTLIRKMDLQVSSTAQLYQVASDSQMQQHKLEIESLMKERLESCAKLQKELDTLEQHASAQDHNATYLRTELQQKIDIVKSKEEQLARSHQQNELQVAGFTAEREALVSKHDMLLADNTKLQEALTRLQLDVTQMRASHQQEVSEWGRRHEQELAQVEKEYGSRVEQVSVQMRRQLQHENNEKDIIMQQCMAAHRALSVVVNSNSSSSGTTSQMQQQQLPLNSHQSAMPLRSPLDQFSSSLCSSPVAMMKSSPSSHSHHYVDPENRGTMVQGTVPDASLYQSQTNSLLYSDQKMGNNRFSSGASQCSHGSSHSALHNSVGSNNSSSGGSSICSGGYATGGKQHTVVGGGGGSRASQLQPSSPPRVIPTPSSPSNTAHRGLMGAEDDGDVPLVSRTLSPLKVNNLQNQ